MRVGHDQRTDPRASSPLSRVTLRDGTAALIWPLLPTDRDLLRRGFTQLSKESQQRRFLVTMPELSDPMVRLLVDEVDGVNHVALLLTVLPELEPVQPVGVARLVRYPDDASTADVAATVIDAWQGRGAGSALLAELLARRPPGVTRLRTTVAAGNQASLAMLKRLGSMTTHPDGFGVLDVQINDLTPKESQSSVPERHAPRR